MDVEEPRDILITNITTEFGNAQHTREMLKVELFRIFKERGYTNKYGQVENIRIPKNRTCRIQIRTPPG